MQFINYEAREKQSRERFLNTPEWTKAEHMESSVPLKQLWTYSDEVRRPSRPRKVLNTLLRLFSL